MRNFLIGLGAGVGFMCLLAFTPSQTPQDNNLKGLFDQVQSRQFRLEVSSPSLDSVKDQEMLLVYTGDLKLMTKYNGSIFYVQLSSK